MSSGAAVATALILCFVPSPASARDQVFFYPRVVYQGGLPNVEISASHRSRRPVSVCVASTSCLTLEYKGKGGAFVAWKPQGGSKPISRRDFVTLKANKGKVVFKLALRPLPAKGKRAFAVGSSHFFGALPSKVEYRFRYRVGPQVVAAARRLGVRRLYAGLALPSSSPNHLRTYETSEVLALVARGDPSASIYMRPNDATVLRKLRKLLRSPKFSVKESAIRTTVATGLPGAARMLVAVARREKNQQLRAFAINGFLVLHPKSIKDDLIRLAASKRIGRDEFPEMMQATLVRAVGLMGDRAYLADLRKLQKRLGPSRQSFKHSRTFAFLLAYARLGDKQAPARLVARLKKLPPRDLAACLRRLPYARSAALARALRVFFTDTRRGPRVAPHVHWRAPRTKADRRRMAEFEKRAYVRIKDEALFDVMRMLPGEPWGVALLPLRKYKAAEFRKVGARLVAR